jgi:predicted thioesterase
MKTHPKVGTTGEQRFVVETKHAIDFASGGMPAVLCPPWLIWFLEHAAWEAVLPLLEPGDSTVGTHIDVQHLTAHAGGSGYPLPGACRTRQGGDKFISA